MKLEIPRLHAIKELGGLAMMQQLRGSFRFHTANSARTTHAVAVLISPVSLVRCSAGQ